MRRQLRVSEEVRHLLSELLRDYVWENQQCRDAGFIVTEVKMSPDLKNATAFVLPLNAGGYEQDQQKQLMKDINAENKKIRYMLGKKAHLKFTPKIYFIWDNSYDNSGKIETLLHHGYQESP